LVNALEKPCQHLVFFAVPLKESVDMCVQRHASYATRHVVGAPTCIQATRFQSLNLVLRKVRVGLAERRRFVPTSLAEFGLRRRRLLVSADLDVGFVASVASTPTTAIVPATTVTSIDWMVAAHDPSEVRRFESLLLMTGGLAKGVGMQVIEK
jgi:hypothetical protein